jgi:hypothetical protein
MKAEGGSTVKQYGSRIEKSRVEDGEYEACTFEQCTIVAGRFSMCAFIDCVFDPPLEPERRSRTIIHSTVSLPSKGVSEQQRGKTVENAIPSQKDE